MHLEAFFAGHIIVEQRSGLGCAGQLLVYPEGDAIGLLLPEQNPFMNRDVVADVLPREDGFPANV